jgi:large subunit ribosomal protein L17
MGHRDKGYKLGRTKSHRDAMLANMAMSLFTHKAIKTTEARAKALKPLVDRLITTAKKDTLASKRQVAKVIHVKDVFKKFYDEVVPKCDDRNSGYTRVMKLGVRRGDGAPLSVVELVFHKVEEAKKEGKDKKKKSGKTKKEK